MSADPMPGPLVKPIPDPMPGEFIKRHRLSTRLWHWLSAVIMLVMLMSGLMIFNAHPRLYWGSYGANPDPAWLEIGATKDKSKGYLRIGGHEFTTTGVLGLSAGPNNSTAKRAFPAWATLPKLFDLAEARRWHLSLAWLFASGTLIFGAWSLINGHIRRNLLPHRWELSPRHIWRQCKDHMTLKRACGAAAQEYNTIQKIVYLAVIGGVIPVLILTGLTMSPWVDAVVPWLLDIFGGRQSARSLHFIAALIMVLFVIVHLLMVIASGPVNEIRSMITGWFRLPDERGK